MKNNDITVELLDQKDEAEYSQFLEQNNSVVQQTLEWRDVNNNLEPCDEPFYFVAKQDNKIVGVLPTFIIRHELGNIMNSLPHHGAYGGVVAESEDVYEALIETATKTAKKNNCVLFTIVSHPFIDDKEIYLKTFTPDFIYENFVLYKDLSTDLNICKSRRRDIKIAERNLNLVSEQEAQHIHGFYKYYRQLMDRYNSRFVGEQYFLDILNIMVPKHKAKFLFAEKDGQIVAGYLIICHNMVVDFIFSAFDDSLSKFQPNSLLVYNLMLWAKNNGYKIWNWQSTKEKHSSVYNYKLRWGSTEGKHYYYTKVLGDISKIKEKGYCEIRKEYLWYYVLPKFAWDGKTEGKHGDPS